MKYRMLIFAALPLLFSCGKKGAVNPDVPEPPGVENTFRLYSPAFGNEGGIPVKHTCDGENVSPELRWENPPPGTKGFALLVNDPDAPSGNFIHWMLGGIPADRTFLREGEKSFISFRNGFGKKGYSGPCPPSGEHRYFFTLYALGTAQFPPDAVFSRFVGKNKIAEAVLEGRYSR